MKTIIYFIENHSINWTLIWSDCSPLIVLFLIACLIVVVYLAKKQCGLIKDEYMVRTTIKMSDLIVKIDDLTAKNNMLEEKLNLSVRKRDKKGHFLISSGKGHGKKKKNT